MILLSLCLLPNLTQPLTLHQPLYPEHREHIKDTLVDLVGTALVCRTVNFSSDGSVTKLICKSIGQLVDEIISLQSIMQVSSEFY